MKLRWDAPKSKARAERDLDTMTIAIVLSKGLGQDLGWQDFARIEFLSERERMKMLWLWQKTPWSDFDARDLQSKACECDPASSFQWARFWKEDLAPGGIKEFTRLGGSGFACAECERRWVILVEGDGYSEDVGKVQSSTRALIKRICESEAR